MCGTNEKQWGARILHEQFANLSLMRELCVCFMSEAQHVHGMYRIMYSKIEKDPWYKRKRHAKPVSLIAKVQQLR